MLYIPFKKLFIIILLLLFIASLVLLSDTALNAARYGLSVWLEVVLPSLLPFFIASRLLLSTSFVWAAGKIAQPVMRPLFNVPGAGALAVIIGSISGFPTGARITRDLYEDGLLLKPEAERLMVFSNNCGPLFITGAIATGILKTPSAGLPLLICHLCASATVGILMGLISRLGSTNQILSKIDFKKNFKKKGSFPGNFGALLGKAVSDSFLSLIAIGGFIILFSVIISFLIKTGTIKSITLLLSPILSLLKIQEPLARSFISGIFEITVGTGMTGTLQFITLHSKLICISLITGWGGLSVHAQVSSILAGSDLSIGPYLKGKFLHGITAAIYMWFYPKIFNLKLSESEAVFNHIDGRIGTNYIFIMGIVILALIISILVFIRTKMHYSQN